MMSIRHQNGISIISHYNDVTQLREQWVAGLWVRAERECTFGLLAKAPRSLRTAKTMLREYKKQTKKKKKKNCQGNVADENVGWKNR